MAIPVAAYNFLPNGLSIDFKDGSSGIPTSWSWDFGFQVSSVEQVSTLQNPTQVFPIPGIYKVSLTAINADGSDTFVFYINVSTAPVLVSTIAEMVQYYIPPGLAVDSIGFRDSIRKWQLYLQFAADIDDTDVFDETKWPPLYNTLIAKCITYDLILKAATGSMAAFISAAETFNNLRNQIISNTMQVADYSVALIQSYPIVVNLIIIDGINKTSPSCADLTSLLAWLNGLGYGTFAVSGGNLVSLGNHHILTTFNYTHNGTGTNTAFTQTNARVVSVNASIASSGGSAGTSKGYLKSLETGPSKAAWYDPSSFWASIFKSVSGGINGQGGGIFAAIAEDICTYSYRIGVQMPMCTKKI